MAFLPKVTEKEVLNFYVGVPQGIILPKAGNYSRVHIVLSNDARKCMLWFESGGISLYESESPDEILKLIKLYIRNQLVLRFKEKEYFGIYAELAKEMDHPINWDRSHFDYWVDKSIDLSGIKREDLALPGE